MVKRTSQQNKAIYALLNKLHLQENKADLAMSFSNFRTDKTSELSYDEAELLIGYLSTVKTTKKTSQTMTSQTDDRANKMRKKILHLCYLNGWSVYDKDKKRDVVDFERLNNWMLKYSYKHKGLNQYTKDELPRLVSQFENMITSM